MIGVRDRAVLRWGAGIVFLLLLGGRGVPAYHAWRVSARERRDLTEARLARARASGAQMLATRSRLNEVNARLATYDSAYVDGDNQTASGAALAGLLSAVATEAEVQLESVQATADSVSHAGVRRVRAKATVRGDLPALAQMIESLEEGMPLVAVRAVELSNMGVTAPNQPEQLHAAIEIEALSRAVSPGSTP